MNTLLWIGIVFGMVVILVGVILAYLRFRMGPMFSGGEVKEPTMSPESGERTASETRIDKNVQFTVYRPATIVPEREYTLLAFAHLTKRRADAPQSEPHPVAEVQRLATKILSDQQAKYEPARLERGFSVPQKGWLLFVPEIEGCTFNPPTQTVQWLNSVQKVEFGLTASAEVDGRDVEGQLTVYLGTTYLTEIPIRIAVDSKFVIPQSQQGMLEETSAEPYRKIFASYSRKDTRIVEDFEAYVQALGDEYLRDVKNIRAGEVWSEKLEELIKNASVFQLFWSSNSMTSEFVKQEWEYALALNREKFIRPVYWEDPRPEKKPDLPPPDLDRLEFYKFPTV
ncbi:MAG TPA: toll/interleukin-1 receptor domain-containing protein, partial [Pyrinomonadaceae bacterium]